MAMMPTMTIGTKPSTLALPTISLYPGCVVLLVLRLRKLTLEVDALVREGLGREPEGSVGVASPVAGEESGEVGDPIGDGSGRVTNPRAVAGVDEPELGLVVPTVVSVRHLDHDTETSSS